MDANPTERFCRVSNVLWDDIMPRCSPSEFMVFNFILRKTLGYNTTEAELSYRQIGEGTGITGRPTISQALQGLEDKGFIFRYGTRRGIITYGVVCDESGSDSEPDEGGSEANLVQKLNQSSSEIELDEGGSEANLVQKLNQSSSEIELDETDNEADKKLSSSEIELDLVQILNYIGDMFKNNKDMILNNSGELFSGEADALNFSQFLAQSIPKIKAALKPIEPNLSADDWKTLIALENRGKKRQSLLEFFDRRANAPPPAVEIYRQVRHRYPARELFAEIAETVGDDPTDLGRWRQTIIDYEAVGWNPTNISNQLEFFRRKESPRDANREGLARKREQETARKAQGNGHYESGGKRGGPTDTPHTGLDAETEARLYDLVGGSGEMG